MSRKLTVIYMTAKIINGRRYDTERAKEVGYNEHGYKSDYNWCMETLYQKRTGEFFLHGEGHAASRYRVAINYNTYGPGSKIMPLTLAEAQEWAEQNLDVSEYEAIFGEVGEEDAGDRIAICVRISPVARDKAKKIAAERKISMGDLIDELLRAL